MARAHPFLSAVLTLSLAASASAQVPPGAGVGFEITLDELGAGDCELTVSTTGELGSATLLSFGFAPDELLHGPGPIQFLLPVDAGQQEFRVTVPEALLLQTLPSGLHSSVGVYARNFFVQQGAVVGTEIGSVVSQLGAFVSEDFSGLTPGQIGPFFLGVMRITAQNGDPTGPNFPIVFDSNNPTGGDTDLETPGYGQFNDFDHGNLVIIAEDVVNENFPPDALVDDPDDEEFGGRIRLDFDTVIASAQIWILDVDPDESFVARAYLGQDLVQLADLCLLAPELKGDNASFVYSTNTFLNRIDLHFGSSGAVAHVQYNPAGP